MRVFSAPPRHLYLWLDRLPLDRLARRRAPGRATTARPLAVIARQANVFRLQALDALAEAEGLRPGMSLADARAQLPALRTVEADPAADLAFLEAIAEACRRYTPALALAPPDGVHLNLTGCEALFGGEENLVEDLTRRLTQAGLSHRYGLADTPALAWALARYSPASTASSDQGAKVLAALPVAALQLDAEILDVLAALGLRRVGQLMEAPRAPLARRLGTRALERLDEALGRRACAVSLKLEIPPYRAERRLGEPLVLEAHLHHLIRQLAEELASRLEAEHRGGRLFGLELFRVDGALRRLEVAASLPVRDPARIARLFAERIGALNEALEAEFGFDLVRLRLLGPPEPLEAQTDDLLQGRPPEAGFALLADRLAARLGRGAVRRFRPAPETRLPERAAPALVFDAAAPPAWGAEPSLQEDGVPFRPLTLFPRPQPIEVTAVVPEGAPDRFRWRRLQRRVVAAEGPERLEPEWGAPAEARVRDYYRLEDETGRRYWVFREGRYGQEDEPRWFLHGLFA